MRDIIFQKSSFAPKLSGNFSFRVVILRQIFYTRYPTVDEGCQASKESHPLGRGSTLFVHIFSLPRKLNIVSDGDDRSDLVIQVY